MGKTPNLTIFKIMILPYFPYFGYRDFLFMNLSWKLLDNYINFKKEFNISSTAGEDMPIGLLISSANVMF